MTSQQDSGSDASVTGHRQDDVYRLVLSGRLDCSTTGTLWERALTLVEEAGPEHTVIDASGVSYCDAAGIALLLELQQRAGGRVEVYGLSEQHRRELDRFAAEELDARLYLREERLGLVERAGRAGVGLFRDAYEQVEFVGKLLSALWQAVRHPRRLRWKEVSIVTEKVGANGLLIVLLIGFLMGLVMAFQAAIILRQFGAEVFLANFIGLSLVRELGPLVTAVVLAGPSASAEALAAAWNEAVVEILTALEEDLIEAVSEG